MFAEEIQMFAKSYFRLFVIVDFVNEILKLTECFQIIFFTVWKQFQNII